MSTETSTESLITRKELADRWRCGPDTIGRYEKAGKLHSVRIGRRALYKLSEVQKIEAFV